MAIRRIVNLPSIDKKKADILNNGIVTPETITDKYGDTKDGELFINKNVDNELLIAKNADGNYIAFEPSKAIDGKFDEVNKRIDGVDNEINGIKSDYIKNISVNGSEGTVSANIASVTLDADDVKVGAEIKINDTVISDETSITVKGSIENIANEIVKNEQTTSGALNDLDGKVKIIENAQIKDVQVNNTSVVDVDTKIAKIDLSEYAKTADVQPKGDYLSADTQYISTIENSGTGNVVKSITQKDKVITVEYGDAGTEITVESQGPENANVVTGVTAEGMKVIAHKGFISTPEGGDKNIIETVKVNDVALPVSDKAVNIDLSEYAKSSDIANNYQPKGEYLSASTEVGEKNVIEAVKVDGTPLDIAEEDKSVNIILSPYAKTSDIENTYITKTEASTTYQPKGEYLSADTQYLSNITTSGEGNVVKEISQDGNNVKVVYGEAGTEVTINEIGAGNVITGITAEGMTVTVNRGQITTPEGGEANIINEIKVNNTPLKPDENKSVNIDLSGYQPKGNYLTSVPSEYANKIEIVKVNGTALNIDTSDKSVNVPIQDYTPTIGENGNWFIGGNDTNVKAKGENGQSAKITGATATATTIAAGTNATVNVKSIGEDLSRGFEFTFEIPKGEKGDPGAKGEKGEDGKSVNIKDSKADCTIIGSDAYVALDESDNQYHLYILKSGSGETGEYRDVGQFAIKGPQGNSVTGITTENITNGTRITFVDSEGKNLTGTVDVINGTNGKNGTPGANGDSITGITSNNVSDGVQVSFRTTNTTNPVIGSVTIPSGKPGTDGLSVTTATTTPTSDGKGTIITFKNNKNDEIGSVTVLNGNDGAAFTYNDFTSEQLEALKGTSGKSITKVEDSTVNGTHTLTFYTGDNEPINDKITIKDGEAFTYDKFTTEQLAALRGESGESITKVEETIYGLNHTITFYAGDNNPLEKTITIKDGESGEPGSNGSDGKSASITGASATTTTLGAGEKATAEVSLTGGELSRGFDFTFGIPKGEKGDDGRDGTSASITGATATVTTLDAGNDATVTVGNTGSEFSRGFNFTFGIPKGEKGDPGQTGPAGPSANAQISGGTCYLMGLTSTTGDIVSTKTNASCFMSGGSLYSQNKEVLTAVTIDNHYAPKDGIKSGGTDYYINSIQYDGKGHITTIETGSTGTLLSNYVTKTELENKKYITGVTSDNHYDPSKNTPFITSGDTSKYINAISFDSNGHVTNIQTANTSDFVSNDTKYQSLSAQVITNKDNIEALSAQVITNKDNIETLSGSVTAFSSSVVTNIEAINKNITTANTLYFIGKSSTANESLGAAELFVASGAYITNSEFYGSAFYETSDERLKYFTSDVNVDFDKLKSIPKKYFMWKNREMNPTNIGTSAQKLQAVYPELVSESEGYLRVDYAKLSVIALAAVDKLHEENEELKERLKKIEEKLGL